MTGTGQDPSERTEELLRDVAARGLRGSVRALPGRPLDGATWQRLLGRVRSQRLSGLLLDAVGSGALPTSGEQAEQAAGQHREEMTVCLHLERMLLEVTAAFDEAGIEHRVLKGCATAHLDHRDPSLRSFGDVDLLVRSDRFDRAVELLAEHGHERRYPQPRPGFDRRFTKSVAMVHPDGRELDLHRTLAVGRFGLAVDLDDLWESPRRFRVGGRDLLALGDEQRFLHSCYHAALGSPTPRLSALRDLALAMEPPRGLDPDAVLARARRWGGSSVVARAIGLAAGVFALAPSPWSRWAESFEPARGDRRALAAYVEPGRPSRARALTAIPAIRGGRDRLAYVLALALPERGYVAPRYRGRARRVWAVARGRRPPRPLPPRR